MSIFAIADLHLCVSKPEKTMNIFSGWGNYMAELEKNWVNRINPDDTVVIAGDISWAMKLDECYEDFAFLNRLPGKKLLMKGNHDYWWNTKTKIEEYFDKNNFDTLNILHNNSYQLENVCLCGSRGWMIEECTCEGTITNREAERIKRSLSFFDSNNEKILFLHYPPLFGNQCIPDFLKIMNQFHVHECYYGHLHGNAITKAFEGYHDGIYFKLISADYLNFCPIKVR